MKVMNLGPVNEKSILIDMFLLEAHREDRMVGGSGCSVWVYLSPVPLLSVLHPWKVPT